MQAVCLPGGAASRQPELMEVAVPPLGEDEVLVQMRAVGLGSLEAHSNARRVKETQVLGRSGTGIISQVGSSVTDYAVGDAVFFSNPAMAKGGTWAQYAVVPAHRLVPKPEGLSFTDAAALPDAAEFAAAALQSLNLQRRRLALVADAATPTGAMFVQMAARLGCWVLAAAQPRHHNYLRSLGAQAVFNLEDPEWSRRVREFAMQGVHGAFAVGNEKQCLFTVRDGGALATLPGPFPVGERDIQIHPLPAEFPGQEYLAAAAADVAEKKLRAAVDRVYPWRQAMDALGRAQSGQGWGTTVLRIES